MGFEHTGMSIKTFSLFNDAFFFTQFSSLCLKNMQVLGSQICLHNTDRKKTTFTVLAVVILLITGTWVKRDTG